MQSQANTAEASQQHSGLTGVVLVHNGERLLDKCLASLAFCDVILIIDSGSTDASLELAQKYNAQVLHHDWQGFDVQFTFAQSMVTTPWFFILDQDELCPPALGKMICQAIAEADTQLKAALSGTEANMQLKESISEVESDRQRKTALSASMPDTEIIYETIAKTDSSITQAIREIIRKANIPVAFSVGRISWYFDRFLKHSGWYPDHILRVFRTNFVEFYQDAHIHYRPLGGTKHLGAAGSELIHYPYASFSHHYLKLDTYAQQGADHLRDKGKKGGVLHGIIHALGRFCRIYFLKRGFLDGKAGFLVACHGSFYAFLKYARVLDASWGAPFNNHPPQ